MSAPPAAIDSHGGRTRRTARASPLLATPERRRATLLLATLCVPTLLMAAGIWQAWTLYALPLALSVPLGGRRGLVGAASVAALALALASGRPEADGLGLLMAFAGFLGVGLAVGAVHMAYAREVRRAGTAAMVDRLTGLYNAAYLEEALGRECRRARRYRLPLSLAILEIDRFEAFVDRYGSEAGNRLLVLVGQAVSASVRGSDVAARLAGGRLALLVPGPAHEAEVASARMCAAVAEVRMLVAGGRLAGATMSAGVAGYEPDDDDLGVALAGRALAGLPAREAPAPAAVAAPAGRLRAGLGA